MSTNPKPTETNTVTLRPTGKDDHGFLRSVYATTRSEELAQIGMDQAQQAAFIDLQFRAQDADYRHRFPDATFSLVQSGDASIGRLYVERSPDEIRILDVTILPQHRNAGIGTLLLQQLLDEARDTNRPIRIYLDNGSASIRLFERFGFRPVRHEDPVTLFEWSATACPEGSSSSD